MAEEMKLVLGLNFNLLKTNLTAMYEKNENGSRILLLPTKVNSPTPVTLEEITQDFQQAFKNNNDNNNDNNDKTNYEQTIENGLSGIGKEGSSFDIKKLTFQLQAAFFYKEIPAKGESAPETSNKKNASNKKEASGATQEPTDKTTSEETKEGFTEYAFAISVDTTEALPDLGFAKLNSLFFAVWNTQRTSVLRQIGAGQIDNMLKLLDA